MALDLGKLLAQDGPKVGPRERSQYIDIDKLVADERNFYELSDIDGLVRNIELIGLQQPIRVRQIGEQFRIVSGHRRTAALRKLVDEGKEEFRCVHCIVETVECSDAMQELRLIYANSDTRKMSSADLSRQAERVEELFYQLKEEGFEFPGRMRDHVAQACQTTKSKLSRLKVIRERLHRAWLPDWEQGKISDAVAYRIAKEDPKTQDLLFGNTGFAARNWTEDAAERAIERAKKPAAIKTEIQVTPALKEMATEYIDLLRQEDERFASFIEKHGFSYFLKHAACLSRRDGAKELKDRVGFVRVGHYGAPDDHWDAMPNGLTIKDPEHSFRKSWTEVWDAMAVEALRRCRLEQINAEKPKPEPEGQLVFNGWMPGGTNPADPCEAVAVFKLGDRRIKRICYWNGSFWSFEKSGVKIEMEPVKWMTLPEDCDD